MTYEEKLAARDRAAAVLLQDDNAVNSLYLEVYIKAARAVQDHQGVLRNER